MFFIYDDAVRFMGRPDVGELLSALDACGGLK